MHLHCYSPELNAISNGPRGLRNFGCPTHMIILIRLTHFREKPTTLLKGMLFVVRIYVLDVIVHEDKAAITPREKRKVEKMYVEDSVHAQLYKKGVAK